MECSHESTTFSARRKSKVCSARWIAAKSDAASPTRPPARARKHREKVTPYDFKRPERVGKEQMRALQTLHEASAAISARRSRPAAHDRRGEADQRRSAHLQRIRLQPRKPDLLQPAQAEPLEGNLILDINLSILLSDHRSPAGRRQRRGHRRPAGRSPKSSCGSWSRITDLFCRR